MRTTRRRTCLWRLLPTLLAAGLMTVALPASASAAGQLVGQDLTEDDLTSLGAPASAPDGGAAFLNQGRAGNLLLARSGGGDCQANSEALQNECLIWIELDSEATPFDPATESPGLGCTLLSDFAAGCQPPDPYEAGASLLRLVLPRSTSRARPYTIDLTIADDETQRLTILENVFPLLSAGVVFGDNGTERIISRSRSRDVLLGRGGNDLLQLGREIGEGGPRNYLNGATGNDTVSAFRNGRRDTVICSSGVDRAIVDLADRDRRGSRSFSDCETVLSAPKDQHPVVRVKGKRLRVKGKRTRVKLSCPKQATSRCKGKLRVLRGKRGNKVIGRARYRIAKGKAKSVRVRLRSNPKRVRVATREPGSDVGPKTSVVQLRLR